MGLPMNCYATEVLLQNYRTVIPLYSIEHYWPCLVSPQHPLASSEPGKSSIQQRPRIPVLLYTGIPPDTIHPTPQF